MSERSLPAGLKHASEAYEALGDRCMSDLSGAEWKVAFYVARRTVGFGKAADKISLGQFQRGIKTKDGKQLDRGTGLSRQAVTNALNGLVERGLLIAHTGGPIRANEYALNWQAITRQADSQKQTSQENGLLGSQENRPHAVKKVAPQLSETLSITTLRKIDSDYQPTNRKNRDSSPDRNFAQVRSLVETTLHGKIDDKELSRIIEAGGTITEAEMLQAITAALSRTKDPPSTVKWFCAVLAAHREFLNGLRPAAPATADYRLSPDASAEIADGF